MHTISEVAARLDVSDATVRRLINSGQLQAVRSNARTIRVPEDALVKYLAGQWQPVKPRSKAPAA